MASRIVGFARAAALAAVVGAVASEAGDAFAIANQLPNNIFWLISTGVFSAVLVPQFVRSTRHSDGGAAYLNKLLTLGLVILAVVTVVAIVVAPWLVRIYTRDWSAAQLQLAVVFALWCLPQILFYGMFSLFGESLNARREFAPAAWAPIANSLVALAGLGAFALVFGVFPGATGRVAQWTPEMIALLGGSTTAGVACQAAVLWVALRRAGVRLRLDFRWRGMGFRASSRIAGWTFALVVIGQLLGIVQSQVTGLATGRGASVFAVATAWLLFMLPYSVIAVSMGTVYFTRFSEHGADRRFVELGNDVGTSTRVLGVAMVGATVAMFIIALPISRFFTDGGEAAGALAMILGAYLIGLVPLAMLSLFQRAFYAIDDARTPFVYTCVQSALLLVGTILVPLGIRVELLAAGVALVQSLATMVQAALAALLLRRRLGRIGMRATLRAAGRSALAAGLGTAFCAPFAIWVVGPELQGWGMSGRVEGLVAAAACGLLFTAMYAVALLALREPFATDILRIVRSRVRRR